MGRANDVCFLAVEEAIRHPVEGGSGVGAAVAVHKHFFSPTHCEERGSRAIAKALAAAIGDIVEGAE